MEGNLGFLNFDGLDDHQVNQLKDLLHPLHLNSEVEFPWSSSDYEENYMRTGNGSTLNVHAPAFEVFKTHSIQQKPETDYSYEYANGSVSHSSPFYASSVVEEVKIADKVPIYSNGVKQPSNSYSEQHSYPYVPKPVNGETLNAQITPHVSSFKLNPTVSCFIPHNIRTYVQPGQQDTDVTSSNNDAAHVESSRQPSNELLPENSVPTGPQNGEAQVNKSSDNIELSKEFVKSHTQKVVEIEEVVVIVNEVSSPVSSSTSVAVSNLVDSPAPEAATSKPAFRSWAQIVSSGQQSSSKVPSAKTSVDNDKVKANEKEDLNLSIDEDKMAIHLGKHLFDLKLDFNLVHLQPRGLINRRNWCYINATLQALFASSPFYTMIRNLPLGPCVERGKSATPVIDSMVKFAYEFSQFESAQEELQVGQPFQPDFIYDMLRDLKSDCLKGQQEDAEEFLSSILNGMHEEMGKILKNYKEKNCIDVKEVETKENGDLSDGEEEWQVIGSKHKGMVTRKVVEHNSPISDLLGGQIKSFLTTSGSKTSASIQPFFTLQLDIQSENVTCVSEALKEMTIKEPIQGYTCAKTKQEVEAYSHVSLQKLPPVLILHLKRFVYNKNGGCKKVMKKTDYPLELELSRDLFSPDVKKSQRIRMYKLFAVMYHDGEEAIKGHYISDVYNHGCKTWIRCDDRQVTAVTEAQVLTHTPPRVPYLLFYQECPL